jgi:hypothetical protein
LFAVLNVVTIYCEYKLEWNDVMGKRRYGKLKEEELDGAQWRTRFERGYGPVVRQSM